MFGNPDDNSGPSAQNTNNMGGQPDLTMPSMPSVLDTPVAPASPSTTIAPSPSDTDNNFVMTDPQTNAPSAPAAPTLPDSPMPTSSTPGDEGESSDLLNLKRQALQQLSPLVGHLEQNPEEQFRTTMMMIQASDDQSLLQKAYDAAQKIEDEKTRAQALLDVVNEINYFTQHKNSSSDHQQSQN